MQKTRLVLAVVLGFAMLTAIGLMAPAKSMANERALDSDAAGSLEGVVLDKYGNRVSDVQLWLVSTTGKIVQKQTNNEWGGFEFEDLEPGRYYLKASHKKYGDCSVVVSIKPNRRTEVELKLDF